MSTPATVLDNLSQHLRNSIALAISLATSYGQPHVMPVMLLYAIAKEEGCVGKEILEKCLITTETLEPHLDTLKRKDTASPDKPVPELQAASRKALEKAMLTAYEFGHQYVGTEHLVYGILTTTDTDTLDLLRELQCPIDSIQEQLQQVFSGMTQFPSVDDTPTDPEDIDSLLQRTSAKTKNTSKKKTKALDKYTIDLTSEEAQKRLDPVIGRDVEIERIIHILSRRTKNNPILLGEPGVGKTAIVEGLAKRIYEKDVPPILLSRRILALDLPLMISGTIYRGEFESRLKQVMDELKEHPNYILFIDELHNIIGAGSNQGTMDAANMLKPSLARGEIRCIGATTRDEYQKFILQDPALNRRFQEVAVDEPSQAATRTMLDGIKKYYESYHHVSFTKEALDAAVELSTRYIHDNYHPDKAIDLIDEAAAAVRVAQPASDGEKKQRTLENNIASLEKEKETAIHEERFDDAKKIKKLLEKKRTALASVENEEPTETPAVEASDVVNVLAKRLRIAANDIAVDQTAQLQKMRDSLKLRVVGQDAAVDTVINTLIEQQLGLNDTKRPQASFLFVGPQGAGIVDLAQSLAQELYHTDDAFIRFDMSEFGEGHAAAKLLGSPAGYVGHNERNHFVDAIKKRPHSVIVFDHIEKAHKDVLHLIEQIMQTGHYTQSNGKKVRFTHATVICTAYLDPKQFTASSFGFGEKAAKTTTNPRVEQLIKERLPQELLERVDDIVLFPPRMEQHQRQHITQTIEQVSAAIKATKAITLTYDDTIIDTLYAQCADSPEKMTHIDRLIRRTISSLLVTELGKKRSKKQYTLTTTPQDQKIVLK